MDVDVIIQRLISEGFVTENDNGTFRLSEEFRDLIHNVISEDPTMFAKLFPDRLH